MKFKKLMATMLIMVVATGSLISNTPAYYAETVNDTESKTNNKDPVEVDIPYLQNISTVLDEQMSLKQMRDSCDSSYDDMHMTANEQIADMEKISNHLNEQYKKYSDYDKLENAKNKMDEQLSEAKSILMSTNGAYITNQYKYNVELAPNEQTIQDVTAAFEDVSKLYYDSLENDMTVKKYRGFYDIGDERENIVKTAMSAIGKITYQWGAKAESEEMPSQLDCSGFVQWVYRAVQHKEDSTLASTASIGSTYEQIKKEELVPGDIGMKNPEGTCYKDANGNVFFSQEAAKASNVEYNDQIKKKIKKIRSSYKKKTDKENKSYKQDIKKIKNGKWKEIKKKIDAGNAKLAENEEFSSNETADAKEVSQNSQNNSTDSSKKNKESSKFQKEIKKDDNISRKTDNKQKKSDSSSKKSKKEKQKEEMEVLDEYHQSMLSRLENGKKKSIKKLKAQLVEENNVTYQIGHVGIYAGKDSDGNDTWIHCTGGDINNVVLTTEEEYDGFQYFYSPIENKIKDPSLGGTRIINIPELDNYNGGKTYEPYDKITSKTSKQFKLQEKAYTDDDGFRMLNGRYMIAVGSGVSQDIGRYVDLVLENGTVIPCIIGDAKADKHTDNEFHVMTKHSRCVSEFIVDTTVMNCDLMSTGNMSNYKEEWNSKVAKFILYDKIVE